MNLSILKSFLTPLIIISLSPYFTLTADTLTVDNDLHIQGNTIIQGNLGVGTEEPIEKLEIEGGSVWLHQDNLGERAPVLKLGDGVNWDHPQFRIDSQDGGGYNNLFFQSERHGTIYHFYRSSNDGEQRIFTIEGSDGPGHRLILYDGTTAQGKIVLNSNDDSYFISGNIGIGTTAPQAKLDVAGDVNISGAVTLQPQGDIPMISYE